MTAFSDIGVILLAAGVSERMGAANKLLLPVAGTPLVRRSAALYSSLGMEVHVVLGHEAEAVREALSGLDVKIILNENYADGQQSSVAAGLASLPLSGWSAGLIALVDQPLLTSEDIAAYCNEYLAGPGDKITVPYRRERRGNPVIIPRAVIEQIRAEGKTSAVREFIDTNPHSVSRYAAPNNHFTEDIDTPEDAARLLRHLNSRG